jgi:hypothetical protein
MIIKVEVEVLREFRDAEIKKSQIESEVLEFKQELTDISDDKLEVQ